MRLPLVNSLPLVSFIWHFLNVQVVQWEQRRWNGCSEIRRAEQCKDPQVPHGCPALVVRCSGWEGVSILSVIISHSENTTSGDSLQHRWIRKRFYVSCPLCLHISGDLFHSSPQKISTFCSEDGEKRKKWSRLDLSWKLISIFQMHVIDLHEEYMLWEKISEAQHYVGRQLHQAKTSFFFCFMQVYLLNVDKSRSPSWYGYHSFTFLGAATTEVDHVFSTSHTHTQDVCIYVYAYMLTRWTRYADQCKKCNTHTKFQWHQQSYPLHPFGWPWWKPVMGKYSYI